MLELDKNLKNNDHKETRKHESLSEVEKSPNNTDESSDVYEEVLKKLDKDNLYSAIAKLKPADFIENLKQQSCLLTEFNEELWYALIEKVIINTDGRIQFEFKNGKIIYK